MTSDKKVDHPRSQWKLCLWQGIKRLDHQTTKLLPIGMSLTDSLHKFGLPERHVFSMIFALLAMRKFNMSRFSIWKYPFHLASSDFGYAENDGWVDKFGCWTKVFRHKLWVSAEKSATVAPRPRKLWSHRRTSIFSKNFRDLGKFPCCLRFFRRIVQISTPSLFPQNQRISKNGNISICVHR